MRPCVRYVIVGLGAAGLACGNGSSGPAATPSEIQVTPLVFNLILGTSQQLGVTVLDVDGRPIPTAPLRFRSEEHTSELQSPCNLVCRLLLEKKNKDHSKRLSQMNLDEG